MQDLQLAANAQQAGQQQTAFGAGLFGQGAGLLGQYQQGQVGALSPFQSTLGVQSGIEQLGQNPLTLGAGLGGQAAAYGAKSGQFTMAGAENAAPFAYKAASYNPLATGLINAGTNQQLGQGISNWWNNANLMNNVVPQSTFTGGITPSEFSNYQSMGIF
jgi:hypothetical protein